MTLITLPEDCGLKAGDVVHIHPDHLPDLVIISEVEANRIASSTPQRVFVVTAVGDRKRAR